MKLFARHPAMLNLTSVLVLGALGVMIVLFVVLSTVDLMEQGLYEDEYQETFVGADACSEETLIRLNTNSSYTGGAFTIGAVSCTTTVSGTGGTRTLSVEANQGTRYHSRLELTVDVSVSPILVTNWEEVL